MANTNQGITLPITAQLTNLKEIATQLKQFSDTNILGNSFSSKTINSELSKVMRALEALELRSKNAFKTEADFSAVEKEANKIENSLDNVKKTITSIPFKDLKIPTEVGKEIAALESKIEALNNKVKDFKALQRGKLLENNQFTTNLNTAFGTQASTKLIEKDYDELYKAIKKGLDKVNNELILQTNRLQANKQLLAQRTSDYKASNMMNWLSEGFQKLPAKPEEYNEQQKLMSQYMNLNAEKDGFSGFKRGVINADKFFGEVAKKFEISPAEMEDIRKRIRESMQKVGKEANTTMVTELQRILVNKDLGAKIFTGKNINYDQLIASASQYQAQINATNESQEAFNISSSKYEAVKAALKEFEAAETAITNKQTEITNALKGPEKALSSLRAAVYANVQAAPELSNAYAAAMTKLNELRATADAGRAKLQQLDSAMGKLTGFSNFVNRYIGLYAIMRKVTQAIRNAFNNIKELDKTITNIAVVTNMTQTDLWSKIGEYTSMAQQFGVATNDVYTVSQIFYQQGLQTAQVMSLTTETLKMAKIAGLEYGEAADAMTVAVRTFKIEMTEAQQVTDTYSALAAKFAVSSAEIANAMEKTASSAANVGMSIQSTSAFISVMVQTTRESAENIGSALKSIISRYGEMKASPSKLLNIDGEEVAFNKVDTALASVGISIKDAAGQFRNFDDVILELAQKWDTLDNNTQRYIATIMAGNRQQSRFIALVSNYDELSRAISTANNAENASIVQVAKTMDSLETKAQQVKNAFSQIYLDLHIENGLKDMYDWLTRVLKTIGKLGMKNGALPTLANLIGFGTGTKGLINMAKNKINEYKGKLTIKTDEAEAQIRKIEEMAKEPIDKKLNLIVDDTQVKSIQANIQSAATTAGASAASALVNATPNAGHNTQFYLAAMARWQSEGKLQTPEQRASFINQYDIDPDSEQGQQINALLDQFSTLTGQAQQFGTALTAASTAAEGAAAADKQETVSSEQAAQAQTQETQTRQQIVSAAQAEVSVAEQKLNDAVAEREAINAEILEFQKLGIEIDDVTAKAQQSANAKVQEAQGSLQVANQNLQQVISSQQQVQAQDESTGGIRRSISAFLKHIFSLNRDSQALDNHAASTKTDNTVAGRKISSWEGRETAFKITSILSNVARMAGTALTAWGASQAVKSTDVNESNKIWTGIGNGISGAGTGASMGMVFGPLGAIIGSIGGFLLGGLGAIIDGANYTLAERIENAKQEAEAANDEALKKQAKVTDLSSQIDNIEQLRKSMYNSTEDMKAYKDAMNSMASEYPGLVSSYDEAGNAIINLQDAEQSLIDLRIESAAAARTAALARRQEQDYERTALEELLTLATSAQYLSVQSGSAIPTTTYGVYTKSGEFIPVRYSELYNGETTTFDLEPVILQAARNLGLINSNQVLTDLSGLDAYTAIEREVVNNYSSYGFEDANSAWGRLYNMKEQVKNGAGEPALNTSLIAEQIQRYPSIFPEGSISGILGREIDNIEDLYDFIKILNTRRNNIINSINTSNRNTDFSVAQEQLLNQAKEQNLSTDQLRVLSSSMSYTTLFQNMLSNKNYSNLWDYQSSNKEDFSNMVSTAADDFFLWYTQLSNARRMLFESLDYTQYRSADEILQKLGITEENNEKIYDAIIQQFSESNQLNRDRILKTIYQQDIFGNITTNLNKDLGGLSKLSEIDKGYIDGITSVFREDSIFPIITQYANYFTEQLLEINNLAMDGYNTLASNRTYALALISSGVSLLNDQQQRDLFNIISNINFNDYESIISNKDLILEYAKNNNLSNDELKLVLDGLSYAEDYLIFNVNTLVETIKDKIVEGSKQVNSIINSNKNGLNFDEALEEFYKMEAQFKEKKSFDQVFTYDAILGKYVYTINGLNQALISTQNEINDSLVKAYNSVQTAENVIKNIKNIQSDNLIFGNINFEELSQRSILDFNNDQPYDFTNEIDLFIKQLPFLYGYNSEADVPEQLKELAKDFIADNSYTTHTSNDFQNFLKKRQYFNINTVSALITDTQQKEKVEEWYKEFEKDSEYNEKTWDNFLEFIKNKAQQDSDNYDIVKKLQEENKNNYKNQLYQSIDWSQLSLGTDFTGTNQVALEALAKELGVNIQDGWNAILTEYLIQLYATYDEDNKKWEFDDEGLAKYKAAKSKIMGEIASSQEQQVVTAINEVLAGGGQVLSDTTRSLIEQTDYLALKYNDTGMLLAEQDYVNSAMILYEAHKENLLTITSQNQLYASILKKSFEQANEVITILSSGASLDIDSLEKLFTTMNLELATYFDGFNWQEDFENVLSTDIFGKTTITDWTGFNAILSRQLGPEQFSAITNTFEYQNAYSSYVDGMIQLDTQMNDLIKKSYDNAFSSITEWKPVNVAQLEKYAPGYVAYLNTVGAATIKDGQLIVEDAVEFARSISTLMIGLSNLDNKDLYNQTGWTKADLAKNWKNAQTVITAVQDSWTSISENLSGLTTDNIGALVEKGNLKLTDVTDIFKKFGDVYVLSLGTYREQLVKAFGKESYTDLAPYQQKQVDDAVDKAQAAIVNKITGLNWEKVLGGTATEFETTTFIDELTKSLVSLGLEIEDIFTENGNIDVESLRNNIKNKVQDEEAAEIILNNISNSIAAIRDTALEEISSGFSLMTEGTTNQADIQKFIQRFNKLTNRTATINDLFDYDSILDTYTLTSDALFEYIEAEKENLLKAGMSQEAVNQYIKDQTYQLISSQMDITGYLSANTLASSGREAKVLSRQIKAWATTLDSYGQNIYNERFKAEYGRYAASYEELSEFIVEDFGNRLAQGGNVALEALIALKGQDNISADEITAVYKAQVNRLQTAAEQLVDITIGSIITGDLIPILNQLQGFKVTQLGDGTGVVTAIGNMTEAYASLYYRMKNSAEATTKELNNLYAQMLTTSDQASIDVISVLNDAMSMSYERLGEILTQYGVNEFNNLEYAMSHMKELGIQLLGNGTIRITNFTRFLSNTSLKKGNNYTKAGEEYLKAYSDYNDALIELDNFMSEKVTMQIKAIADAKNGSRINLSYLGISGLGLSSIFDFNLDKTFKELGASITNDILTIENAANIPEIMHYIIDKVSPYEDILSSDLAELSEAISAFLQNLSNLIKSGITGTLKETEAQQLQEWALGKGIENINFIQTREGLKLSQQSAIELYNTLKRVDALQASLVFDELNNSLKETNEHYNSITDILSHIKTLNDEIAKLPVDDKRRQKYEQELALAKEILAVRSTSEDDSFNFMSNKIPGGQNNPLNYANNWMKAFTTIRDSFNTKSKGDQAGFIDYEDWYNIVNEINNLAALTEPIEIGALKFDGSLKSASAAIQAGCNSLTKVDTGELKVNLTDVGIDIQSGADLMGKGIDKGIDKVADSQIKMLDGLIAMMELIVQMEQLGNLDIDSNGIDLGDIFTFSIDGDFNSPIKKINKSYSDWSSEILKCIDENNKEFYNEDLANIVNGIKLGQFSLADILSWNVKDWNTKGADESFRTLYSSILQALTEAAKSGNYDLDNIQESLQTILAESGLTDKLTFNIGDITYTFSGGVVSTVDWSKPDKQQLISRLTKNGQNSEEQARSILMSYYDKYNQQQPLGVNLKYALMMQGYEIELDDKDEVVSIIIDGNQYRGDDAISRMYQIALEDAGFNGQEIKVNDDGIPETTYSLKGHEITVSYDKMGFHYAMKGIKGTYSSQEEMLNNAFGLWQVSAGQGFNTKYDQSMSKEQFIFQEFGIRVQVQPNITDEQGNKFDINNPTIRKQIMDTLSGDFENAQTSDGNIKIPLENGITYTLPGEGIVDIDGNIDQEKLKAELRSALGLDSVLIDNISLGIQQAFTDLPEIKFDADTKAAIEKLDQLKAEASNVDFTLALNDNQVKTAIQDNVTLGNSKPVKQSINVNHNYVANAIDNNVSKGANNPVLQEVRQSGGGGSDATGNVGSAMATGTLMGELGPELVVSGGRYFVAGQNGAEFVNLAPDAIVFNHLQTEQLLKNGMSSSRGKAVTNERNAVAYASGNVSGGPAMASAASALQALKELRAMWQSLLNASLSDLAQLAGGGGGGGGGKKNDAGFARDLERWYNLLRQIADLEKQITYQETLRKKLESDRIIDGKAYYQSQKESLRLLDAEMTRQHELIYLQEDYYKRRQEELNNSKLNTIFTFNEDGLLQLREDEVFTFGKGTKYEFTGTGFEAFSEIFKRDEHEVPKYTAEEQYNMAKAFGWGEYMQYDSSGNKIDVSEEGGYANAVKAFSDKFDSTQKEFEELHDELEDTKKELLTKADERNQQLQAIIDNQVSLENRILSAIENMRQKSIDNAKDQKDAIQESAEKFIDGLSNSLDKERNMYETAENDNELQRMKRQLAILQRSGGSASQIRSLQQNIAERERDTYFQAQQDQIDAIKEASDAEIDRLEHEISIMEETLAYQKEHGLLWQDVYQVMAQTPEQIKTFLLENSKDLEGKSTLQIAEDLRTIKSEIEQWVSRRDDDEDVIAAEPGHNWDVYYPAAKNNFNLDDEADAALIAKAKQAYEERYAQTGDEVEAAAAADAVFEPYKKAKNPKYAGAAGGSEVDNNNVNNTSNQPAIQSKGNGLGKVVLHRKDMNGKTIASDITFEAKAGVPIDFFSVAQSYTPAGYALSHATPADTKKVINGGTLTGTGYYTVSVTKKTQETKLALINPTIQSNSLVSKATNKLIKPLAGFDSGGLANYTGLAMVHGTPQDPEAFLDAEETHMWRDKILSGNSGSLTSMLLDFQNMVSGMVNSESYSSIGTGEGINIENAVVNMNATISNDYDARRAADNVMDEIVRIARKTTAQQARR